MFEFITLMLPIYVTDSILSCIYGMDLLKPKYSRKVTITFWVFIYLGINLLIYEKFGLNRNIVGIIVNLIFIFLLQFVFMTRDYQRQFFVSLSFVAGKDLIKYVTSVLYYLVSEMTGDVVMKMILSVEGITMERVNVLSNIYLFLQNVISVAVYVLIFYMYLKMLGRKFVYKDYETSVIENIFLIFPCVTALCISVTLRLLILEANNGMVTQVYETIPAVSFWVIIICILLLGSIIATMMLFQYLIQHNEESRKQIILENQMEQLHREIEEIGDVYSDLRGLKHDMRSHLNNIMQYVKGIGIENDKEIDKYIDQIEQSVNRLDFSAKSGNPITDIIIYQRQQEAGKQGIAFDVDFVVSETGQIDIYDIAVILNNALDNAFDACRNLSGNKEITLRSYQKGTLFFIEVENDFEGSVALDKVTGLPLTSKKNKSLHGIGLSNIQKCARKYMGDLDIEIRSEGGRKRFVLTVMMSEKISLQK